MPEVTGGGTMNTDNNNPGPDIEQPEEQPAAEEPTQDRGVTGPSEIS
ncbi:hypothetical protein [Streptacidiphilus anmyonensis]|nr:hypothetical protein [Streptacidiphilus anmyonensis]